MPMDEPPVVRLHTGTQGQQHQQATNTAPVAATYNVLSSAASSHPGGAHSATLLQPSSRDTAGSVGGMRFTPASAATGAASSMGQGGGASSNVAGVYQASQAAHAAHVAATERAERDAARHAKDARSKAARSKRAARIEAAQAHSSGDEMPPEEGGAALRARKHSFSVSSKSHRTDMFGMSYLTPNMAAGGGTGGGGTDEAPPLPPPMSTLHRSPSFEKRLVDSARFAGTEIEDEDDASLSCAGVCAGSCCAPSSSYSSHNRSSRDGSAPHPHSGWHCHKPTWPFMGRAAGVLLVIIVGVLLSAFLFVYLRNRELDSFQSQLNLLCLERSNTVQSQLNFSTTVLKHYLGYFALVKGGSAVGNLRPLGTFAALQRYARLSQTNESINFLLHVSTIRNVADALRWENNYDSDIVRIRNLTRVPYNFTDPSYEFGGAIPYILPVDVIVPQYPGVNLIGWDGSTISTRLAESLVVAARLGTFLCFNRSTLLQDQGSFGFIVMLPLFIDSPAIPPTPDERESAWIGTVVGIIPIQQVVERAMSNLDAEPVQLTLLDRSAPEATSFLYRYEFDRSALNSARTLDHSTLNEDEAVSTYFDYGQRVYEVRCVPSRDFVDTAYSSTPLIVAVGCGILFGVVLIMVLIGCLYSSMRRAILRSSALAQANRHKNTALDMLREAKRISDEANRSKSDFLAFLCHELRNPLHAIVAMIEFLQSSDEGEADPVTGVVSMPAPLSESQQESIDTIQNSVKMMSTIVNDALDMSKIEAGKITFEIMRFSFVDLVTSLSQCEKPRAQAKGIQLLLNIHPNVPPYLYGDPTRIRQVCTNLLSNSIKFTSKGYVLLSLTKISVDSFALPMMSVEEAGESRFQSDMSHTQAAHTVLGGSAAGAPGAGGAHGDMSVVSATGLGAAAAEYRQPPGATPGIGQRRLGGGGAGTIDQIEEDDEDGALLAASLAASPSVPSPNAAAAGMLEMVSPAAPQPVLHASFNYSPNPNLQRTLSDGSVPSMTQAQQMQAQAPSGMHHQSSGSPLVSGDTPPSFPSGMAGSGAAGAAAGLATFPGAGSRGSSGAASGSSSATPGANRPFTHVPLRPSGVPSSSPTLLEPAGDRLLFGRDIARESLPASGSRLGRDHSSRTSSSHAHFASENVILEISVTDTGMGIDPQALPLLFLPYSQAKLSVMRSFGGTGLGLAIVKQIVEMMQGSISVKSQVGEGGGTTMCVRLPLPTAPAFDSSGEVSENSHTTSSKHSRSQQQEVLMRRSGSAAGGGGPFGALAGLTGSGPSSSGDDSHPVSGLGGGMGVDSSLNSPPTSVGPLPSLPQAARPAGGSGGGGAQATPMATPSSYYSHMDSRTGYVPPSHSVPPSSSMFMRSIEHTPRAGMAHLQDPHSPHASQRGDVGTGAVAAALVGMGVIGNGAGSTRGHAASLNHANGGGGGGSGSSDDEESAVRPVTFHDDEAGADESHHDPQHTVLDIGEVSPEMAAGSRSGFAGVTAATATPPGLPNGPSESTYTSDVRNRLAALAFAEGAPSNSATSTPTMTMKSFSRPLSKPPRSGSIGERPAGAGGANSAVSSAAASSSASKKSVAAALAGMSLQPENSSGGHGSGSGSGSGSLAQLAANRSALTPVYPRDLNILIADDSPTNLKILARMLQGYNVTQAINGAEAVARVRDLILADPPLQPFEGDAHAAAGTAAGSPAEPTLSDAGTASVSSGGAGASLSATSSPAGGGSPFAVGFSPTPQHAFVKQKGRQFDIIFSDVIMPVLDGQQASREIRQLERVYHLPPVPIVALTANAFLEDRNKCAAAGMNLFISKPFSKADILSIVQHVCQQSGLTLMSPTTGAASGAAAAAGAKRAKNGGSGAGSGSARNSPSLSSFLLTPPAVPLTSSTPTTPSQGSATLYARTAPQGAAFPSKAAHQEAAAAAAAAASVAAGGRPPHHHSSASLGGALDSAAVHPALGASGGGSGSGAIRHGYSPNNGPAPEP